MATTGNTKGLKKAIYLPCSALRLMNEAGPFGRHDFGQQIRNIAVTTPQ
jgi:hypothetical protein